MHRLHHAHTDTASDPHSPHNSHSVLAMLWDTRNNYIDLHRGKTPAEDKYRKGLPEWVAFDKLAHNWVTRLLWAGVYVAIYAYLATAW